MSGLLIRPIRWCALFRHRSSAACHRVAKNELWRRSSFALNTPWGIFRKMLLDGVGGRPPHQKCKRDGDGNFFLRKHVIFQNCVFLHFFKLSVLWHDNQVNNKIIIFFIVHPKENFQNSSASQLMAETFFRCPSKRCTIRVTTGGCPICSQNNPRRWQIRSGRLPTPIEPEQRRKKRTSAKLLFRQRLFGATRQSVEEEIVNKECC